MRGAKCRGEDKNLIVEEENTILVFGKRQNIVANFQSVMILSVNFRAFISYVELSSY